MSETENAREWVINEIVRESEAPNQCAERERVKEFVEGDGLTQKWIKRLTAYANSRVIVPRETMEKQQEQCGQTDRCPPQQIAHKTNTTARQGAANSRELLWKHIKEFVKHKRRDLGRHQDEVYFELYDSYAQAEEKMRGSVYSPDALRLTVTFKKLSELLAAPAPPVSEGLKKELKASQQPCKCSCNPLCGCKCHKSSPRDTQAGPRCPKCGSIYLVLWYDYKDKRNSVSCSDCKTSFNTDTVDDFAQFFPSPEQGWVSVNNPPDKSGEYEVCVNILGGQRRADIAYWQAGGKAGWRLPYGVGVTAEVTHYRVIELPAPPRPSTEEGK